MRKERGGGGGGSSVALIENSVGVGHRILFVQAKGLPDLHSIACSIYQQARRSNCFRPLSDNYAFTESIQILMWKQIYDLTLSRCIWIFP